ncbi:MAG: lipopolysaccharide heptosyltransferase family protein [Betaproteobacteria bacterium]|nr:lipopolysaccharide heptosyltransferase family protein [Betaproteobacteria bacterium]NBU49190.1 lipopolysaccharide heptosyltransferase family protein [Betaproteobacteria bacterium]NBX95752.1 lipopolysaccharide heptosyltransferase family protein [Betaproteobacteria bacterium]
MLEPGRPLIIRLRNWVGDVVLSTPVLLRLQAQGYALTLVGKGWAVDLLAGFDWPVLRLGATHGQRVAQLAQWRREVAHERWGSPRGMNAISFPYSASSALEMRLAGLRAMGYDGEGRALWLHRSWPRPRWGQAGHELEVYWRLGQYLLGTQEPAPDALHWRVSAPHQEAARELMQAHQLGPGFVMLCPFAGGTFEGQDKRWPHFEAFAQRAQRAWTRPLVLCPGPGEEREAAEHYPGAVVLPQVNLGTCAALMQQAALMVSNDTGPGHLAAAVGTPLLSVLGPTEPGHWGAWGPTVQIVRHWPRWPTVDEVWAAANQQLAR